MSALLVAGLTPAAALIAIAIYDLQERLERWDYRRHAEDEPARPAARSASADVAISPQFRWSARPHASVNRMSATPRTSAVGVVLAAGMGTRVGADGNKAYLPLAGRSMVSWSVDAVARTPEVDRTVLVFRRGERDLARERLPPNSLCHGRTRRGRRHQTRFGVQRAALPVGRHRIRGCRRGADPRCRPATGRPGPDARRTGDGTRVRRRHSRGARARRGARDAGRDHVRPGRSWCGCRPRRRSGASPARRLPRPPPTASTAPTRRRAFSVSPTSTYTSSQGRQRI